MKKKKGSSLIFVLVTLSVIITFGFAVLSLTLVSYQKRFVETTEKRNQYFSESGLDVAYGVIGNIVDGAIKAGNEAVVIYMNSLNGENGIIQQEKEKLKNGEKPAYPRADDNMKSLYIKDDGITVDEDYIKQQQNNEFQDGYKVYVMNNIKDNWKLEDNQSAKDKDLARIIPISDDDYKSKYENQEQGINKPTVKIYNKDNQNQQVQIAFNDVENYRSTDKKQCVLPLYLRSSFVEKSVQKTIVVHYDILTPNYNAPYYVSTNKFQLPITSVWNNKAFCIDGNFKIRGNFNVKGDMYVKGTGEDDGGININNTSSLVTLTGNTSTSQNFQISKASNSVTVNGNVYAQNVEIKEGADGSSLIVKDSVYTDNDLVLNSTSSHMDIAKFYGINDISKFKANKVQTKISSCIRVNTDDIGIASSINIRDEAILMGTAYIKTNDSNQPFYQTGESVAIKGNYRAYTNPLTSTEATRQSDEYGRKISLKEDNVIFEYIDPFRLVTKFNDDTNLNWQDKSDYFNIYVQEHKNDVKNGLNLGDGITLPMVNDSGVKRDKNIIHTGAIIADKDVYNGNYTADNEGKVGEKQRDFAKMVYEMGYSNGSNLDQVYADGKVKKAVYSSDADVEPQVDFTKIKSNGLNKTSVNDIIYLNNLSNNDCVIIGKDATNIPDGTQIKLDGSGKGRGIIITKGNVYFCGKIDFTGVIIAAGNAEVKDDEEKLFTVDNSYTQRLIAYNYEKYFKDLFTGTPESTQDIQANSEITTDNNIKSDVIRNSFIVMGNWKIEK